MVAKRNESTRRSSPPARTKEARENQLISLAVDLAEKQLKAGTASAQVITHYLKLDIAKETLEREKLKQENILLAARTDAIKSAAKVEELYTEAIRAMRKYGGEDENYD